MVVGRFGRQCSQSLAVKADAVSMDPIGVLLRVHPARLEPDLTLDRIDMVDPPDDPLTSGDLVFERACPAVEKIQMLIPVALGCPDDLLPVIDIVTEDFPASSWPCPSGK